MTPIPGQNRAQDLKWAQEYDAEQTTKELATITEYGPPYWDDRAWNPDRIEQRERRLFRALHTGDPYKVLRQLSALERRYTDLAEPYGKTRAFAIDMP